MKVVVTGPLDWHPWFLVRSTVQEYDLLSTIFAHADRRCGVDEVLDRVVLEAGGSVTRGPRDASLLLVAHADADEVLVFVNGELEPEERAVLAVAEAACISARIVTKGL